MSSSLPYAIALKGFGIGAGLIIAIGAQNAFVLKQGLRRHFPMLTALTCALCDAILICAGLLGAGAIINAQPALARYAAWFGAAFLFAYGWRAARAALQPASLQLDASAGPSRPGQIIVTTLGFSLLNPHVYLDTVVLLGSIGSQYGEARWLFGLGAVSASFCWFFALAFGAAKLAPLFARPMAWRLLDSVVALTMWAIATSLLLSGPGALQGA